MASRAAGGIAKNVKSRLFSAQAGVRQAEFSGARTVEAPKITSLSNGVVVASIENRSHLSRLAIVVNAGSRFEDANNIGITHALRAASRMDTEYMTTFNLTRELEQYGGNFRCFSSREHMYYCIDFKREYFDNMIQVLKNVTVVPSFKEWQFPEVQPIIELERTFFETQPQMRAFDLLHQAAFRNTLGNSLYAPEYNAGNLTPEIARNFWRNNFTTGRVALVGLGVDHGQLVEHGERCKFSNQSSSSEKSSYKGGEIRINTGRGGLAAAAVAVQGPSLSDKDLLNAGVLQHVMGAGTNIKYSNDDLVSKLGQAVSQTSVDAFSVSCFNANYSDNGLFGFTALANGDNIGKVLEAAFAQFANATKGNISDQDVARAKNQLKSSLYMHFENGDNVLSDLGEQVLMQQQVVDVNDIVMKIDAITTADVSKLAKRIINTKPSMAIVGDIGNAPYLDDLYR